MMMLLLLLLSCTVLRQGRDPSAVLLGMHNHSQKTGKNPKTIRHEQTERAE